MPRAGEFTAEAKELSAKLCTVGDCTKPLRARGMCCMHWARWRKYGTPEPWAELCAVDGCDNKSRSRTSEYCEKHYYRLRRTGACRIRSTSQVSVLRMGAAGRLGTARNLKMPAATAACTT